VTITAGQTSNVVVQIEATGRVQGFVRRPNGTGVADVQVTFSSSVTSKSTTTDATGAYVFEDVQEGAGTIYAQSYNSGATGQATTTVVRDVTQQVNITLSPTGTLTGRVSNPDGSPVANGQLFIYGVVPSQYAYTDADGNYTFTDILIGCCINMTAYSTDGSGVTRQASVQLTSDGQVLVQNFVLPARVTLRVQVFDAAGSPFASANVYLNNGYRGTTDGNGFLTLPGVWQTPYTLQATYYSVGTIGYASGTITDADHGRVIDVRIDSAKSATFSGTLYAADGATRIPGYVYVYDVASGGYASQWAETGAYQLTFSINSAGYRIDSYPAGGGDALTRTGTVTSAGQAVANDFTFPLSVIQGFARYANQNPVEYPSVFIEGLGPDGHTQTFYSQRNGPDGSFIVLGVGVGPFNILAQDNNGLIGAATGQVTVITTPVFADVQMLGVGVVRGRVMDGSEPVQYTSVTLTPSVPLAPSLSTGTNVVGVFAIGDVPATNFTIRACANSRCGTASGTLTPGGDVTVNINLPPPAFLNGVVYGLDGVTPAPGVYVAIQGGNVFYSMYTNASGQFEFNGLPDGNYVVSSTDYPSAAAVPVVLLSGRFTQATLRLGTALTAGPTLSGADGIQYDLDCRGRLMNGGIGDDAWAYALAERLRIDGRQFNCESVVTVEDANREAVFGPSPVSDGESEPKWEVTRKVYVPESGRFARFLEIVKNITSATQTLTLRLESGLYSGNALILPVSPSSTGSTYAVTGTADASTTMALGHVFAGAGGQLPSLNFVPGSTSVSDEWEMTVPAGASIAILHFSAQRSPSDIAGATTQAAALAALTDPEALTGLSPVERGLVRNFVVPGGVVPNTGSVTGQVLDVDGTAVGSATVYALDAESGRILAKTVTSPTGAYRIDNVSGPAGVRLLALEPQNEDNGATSLVMFSTPGELLTNVTLRFAQ
jgi:hypothetical protein